MNHLHSLRRGVIATAGAVLVVIGSFFQFWPRSAARTASAGAPAVQADL